MVSGGRAQAVGFLRLLDCELSVPATSRISLKFSPRDAPSQMTPEKVHVAVLLKGQLSEDGWGGIRTTLWPAALIVSPTTPLHLQYLRSQQNLNLGCVSVMCNHLSERPGSQVDFKG